MADNEKGSARPSFREAVKQKRNVSQDLRANRPADLLGFARARNARGHGPYSDRTGEKKQARRNP